MMKNKRILFAVLALLILGLVFWYFTSGVGDRFDDANSNGVRDDVEAKIKEKYGYSENIVNGLLQEAKAMQKASSEEAMTKERAYEISREMDRAYVCLELIANRSGDRFFFDDGDLEAWVVNSYSRAKIYSRYNAFFSGTMLSIEASGYTCDFEVK